VNKKLGISEDKPIEKITEKAVEDIIEYETGVNIGPILNSFEKI